MKTLILGTPFPSFRASFRAAYSGTPHESILTPAPINERLPKKKEKLNEPCFKLSGRKERRLTLVAGYPEAHLTPFKPSPIVLPYVGRVIAIKGVESLIMNQGIPRTLP